jgi:hypothetical protein
LPAVLSETIIHTLGFVNEIQKEPVPGFPAGKIGIGTVEMWIWVCYTDKNSKKRIFQLLQNSANLKTEETYYGIQH